MLKNVGNCPDTSNDKGLDKLWKQNTRNMLDPVLYGIFCLLLSDSGERNSSVNAVVTDTPANVTKFVVCVACGSKRCKFQFSE